MGNPADEMDRVGILADGLTPEGRDYWIYPEMLQTDKNGVLVPSYTVKEVALVFFAKSADWLRWRSRPVHPHEPQEPHSDRCRPDGYFVLDDEPIVPERTEHGARVYSLANVERMAHALTQNGGMSTEELIETIMIIKWTARRYKIDIDNGVR
jgi:hypothetical protein